MARFITTQDYDTVSYRGKSMVLLMSPLESHPDPVVLERIRLLAWKAPRLRRGYIADWLIEDDRLLLAGLQVRSGRRHRYTRRRPKLVPIPLGQVFADTAAPIPATWVDGVLVVGERQGWFDQLGLWTSFFPDTILSINCGTVEAGVLVRQAPNFSTVTRLLQSLTKRLSGAFSLLRKTRIARIRLRLKRR